jgi:hypothetical protein
MRPATRSGAARTRNRDRSLRMPAGPPHLCAPGIGTARSVALHLGFFTVNKRILTARRRIGDILRHSAFTGSYSRVCSNCASLYRRVQSSSRSIQQNRQTEKLSTKLAATVTCVRVSRSVHLIRMINRGAAKDSLGFECEVSVNALTVSPLPIN